LAPLLLSGCGHLNEARQARAPFEEANALFTQGNYQASLDRYRQISEQFPTTGDRVLFEMGIVYSYPKNEQKDYQKALESFRTLVRDYPASQYRQNSETMIFHINSLPLKDRTIADQQARIETLRREIEGRDNEIAELRKKIETLEKKAFAYALRKVSADRIVIEKEARRLTLFTNGEVLKTYRIALGGNPVGPKERQGDHKTPEGTYVIDARNRNSQYHLSLHISYPNERDRKRARELGVSPGGNIMIHGLKNGYSWVGEYHAGEDWTKGCIAVTDEEIEEIDKLAPIGTPVEIRP
jgi:tetratricopeptide (TPR) repeat protein